MNLLLVNLPYCAQRQGFLDEPLRALDSRRLLASREFFYLVGGIPHLSLLLEVAHSSEPAMAPEGVAPKELTPTPSRQERREAFVAEREELGPPQRERFERLRSWRAHRAEAEGVPLYVILTNKELITLARQNPGSKSALRQIPGLGQRKVERYGDILLEVLSGALSPADETEETPNNEQ